MIGSNNRYGIKASGGTDFDGLQVCIVNFTCYVHLGLGTAYYVVPYLCWSITRSAIHTVSKYLSTCLVSGE
ncbi:hypothetical protein P168DRAFT_21923 [Aspergillus campestris IBT 28561]|uniref:Uncharacterized protein n=1 Tax=Aspergillus campestris (strain IBT 28561) TaxID=1392248 RepID=A0A2I1DFT6_ASPC2|nr:uncharacterized protein P168DRAFT_21923 [Aspergillus campestris IBT 28561]PKY08738.1 hypothetical protein P168DRAFT_21923 [Aspergillus campestris IBT 28561]